MKRVGLVADEQFERHVTGVGFPESPERLVRIGRALDDAGLSGTLERVAPEAASDAMLTRVHDPEHLARLRAACKRGEPYIDSMDVPICKASEEIARLAAGSLAALARKVVDGELDRGFAALRPPGHHAERDLAMGFCLYNNVAVAAADLIATGRAERVLICDWDVHHGNGTQHIFEERADVFFFSVHQSPLYPGTGAASERGRGAGAGATLNCPLPPGSGDEAYLATLSDALAPAARAFGPDAILVSAGFDAHAADPLAGLEVSTEGYVEATRILCELADELCAGRLISTLEGGYDLGALADSSVAHLRGLLA